MNFTRLAALAIVPLFTLTACGGEDTDTPTPTPVESTSPSSDPTDEAPTETPSPSPEETETPDVLDPALKPVSQPALDFGVPKEWEDRTTQAKEFNDLVQIAYGEKQTPGTFAQNVNYVQVALPGDYTEEELQEQFRREITSLSGEVKSLNFEEVDGVRALLGYSTLTQAGMDLHIFQLQASIEGQSNVITVSGDSEADTRAVFEKIIDSVRWK